MEEASGCCEMDNPDELSLRNAGEIGHVLDGHAFKYGDAGQDLELAEPSQASEDLDLRQTISFKMDGIHMAARIAHLACQMVKKIRWLTNERGELVAMTFELDEVFHASRSWDPQTQGKDRRSRSSDRGSEKLGALVSNPLSS